jgi:hypothetical protein
MLQSIAIASALSFTAANHYPPESRFISAFVREFFPGGTHAVTFKDSFNSTYNPYAFQGPLITHPDGLKEQTFLSRPLELSPGEVINNYSPINWPEGNIRIKSYSGDIVKLAPDADLRNIGSNGFPNVVRATREEVYLHHWTVNKWQLGKEDYAKLVNSSGRDFSSPGPDSGMNTGANSPCGEALLHFIFGAGNEVRGPPASGANYFFPDPYGIESDSRYMHEQGIVMLFNAHLIDIRGVTDRRGCTECECNVTGVHHGGRNYTGGLECCHSTQRDGGKCPVSAGTPQTRQSYFVQYTLTWREQDDAIYKSQPFKPLNVMTLDQSDDSATWFDPFAFPGSSRQSHDALKNDPVSMASLEGRHSGMMGDGHVKIHWDGLKPKLDTDIHGCHVEYWVPPCEAGELCVHRFVNSWKIPYDMEVVAVHNHFHFAAINMTTSVENGADICVGLPTYAGGFLVENSNCRAGKDKQMPVIVRKGEAVRVDTFYEQDQRPHFGVMGFSMMYVHRSDIRSRATLLV